MKNKFTQQSLLNPFYKLGFGIYLGFRIWNLGFISPVHAQSASLSISPPVVEIMLAPGKKITQTFTLTAGGDTALAAPTLHLATPTDEDGHVTIDPNPLVPSSIPLIYSLSGPAESPTLTLESATVDTAQDLYLALVFAPNTQEGDARTTTITPGIAALILVTINPTGVMPINLDLADFDLPFIHDTWSPLSLSPIAKNQSPIMVRPTGEFAIAGPTGNSIFTRHLYPNLILGNSSRKLSFLKADCEKVESQNCADPLPFSWQPHWSNLGPHRLTLTLTTQGGTKITQIEKTLWLFPIRQTIIIFAILLLITVVVLNTRRNSPQNLLDTPQEKN